jgi:hypothetical protein
VCSCRDTLPWLISVSLGYARALCDEDRDNSGCYKFILSHRLAGSAHLISASSSRRSRLYSSTLYNHCPGHSGILVWTRYQSAYGYSSSLCWKLSLACITTMCSCRQTIIATADGHPQSHSRFVTSAGVIALIELAATLYGAFCLGRNYGQTRTVA